MKHVSTFKDVIVEQDSLLLCDIDDTVLDYGEKIENYWKSKIIDPDYLIWHDIICSLSPKLTDYYFYTFIEKLKELNVELHFITARNSLYTDITNKHLSELGMGNFQIHYLSGFSKGDYINNNFDSRNKVFIDDSKNNIDDVISKIPKCKCYLFKKESSLND